MSCPYINNEKDTVMSGIYCNRMGGRPGVKYWDCYCNHRYSDCPIYGGDDPYELDPRTTERKKREEDQKKANEDKEREDSERKAQELKQKNDALRKAQQYEDKFWMKVSPYWNKPSVLVTVSRIVLAIVSVFAWYYGLPYDTPRAVEWMYLIFGVGQLVSFIFAYLLTDQHKVRVITWSICWITLAIMILLLYLNYNFKMVLFLVLITFCVPILWYGLKLLVKIAELVVKLL